MNLVLRSSVNPTYEFDNLSEKQVHVGSGRCKKTAAATKVPVAAPRPGAQPMKTWLRDADRVPTLHWFFVLPAKEAHAVR